MAKYEFITQETGILCSEEYNESVSKMLENHPVLDEMLHIDREILYFLTKDILSGKLKDWDSREELIECMLDWNYPDLNERIERAVLLLKQNSGMV